MDTVRGFSIIPFVEARAREMETLTKIVRTVSSNKRVFQNLPRHMRRRAMSHNIKRLPRRLHTAAKIELEKQNPPAKNKRPSRKHRRRPRNLMLEYARRQKKHAWLETHIWHAKRFKMADMWGFRIPLSPNDKGQRAAYRATAKHCLIQDISYFGCIELTGLQEKIIEGMAHLTNSETGLSVAAKATLDGSRHGSVMLYANDSYPSQAIGPVSFLWRSVCDIPFSKAIENQELKQPSLHRQLWLWVHPSCFSKVLQELNNIFTSSTDVIRAQCGNKDINQSDESANIRHTSLPQCVSVTSLKNSLLRFRLTGPLSQTVLIDTLKSAVVDSTSGGSVKNPMWWSSYYSTAKTKSFHTVQEETWRSMQGVFSPADVSTNCVLSCTVRDPRIFLPRKRVKVMPDPNDVQSYSACVSAKLPPGVSASPLWDAEVRQQVKETKMTEQALNQRRSDLLVPGSQLELGDEESRVPVILLQRPGRRENPQDSVLNQHTNKDGMLGYGCGWDIIVPAGWGMAFWVAFNYRGARAGGLKEMKATDSLEVIPHFPDDMPDTAAGKVHEHNVKQHLLTKYCARPPAKRPNYTKLGTPTPFHYPWEQLIKEWKGAADLENPDPENAGEKAEKGSDQNGVENLDGEVTQSSFTVLRSRKQLRILQGMCVPRANVKNVHNTKQARRSLAHKSVGHPQGHPNLSEEYDLELHQLTLNIQFRKSLVPVRLNMILRGTVEPFSMVCIPTKEDLETLSVDQKYGGPMEHLHKDPNKGKKKMKKKKSVKDKSNEESSLDFDMKKVLKAVLKGQSSADSGKENQQQIERNDIGKDSVVDLINHCSRKVIGYVKNGGYALSSGHGAGLAFCSYVGLIDLLKSKQLHKNLIALVRSPKSLQYRFAYLSISVN